MTDKLHADLKSQVAELELAIKRLKKRVRQFTEMGHTTHAVFEAKRLREARDALVKVQTKLAVYEIETHPTVLPYMGAR
jgi:histone acetyltransferase (RNA polymerase elongator complex component)